MQQQTSTLTQQKFGWFYVKFSVESNELGLFFLKTTGKDQKMITTEPKGVIQRLRVNVLYLLSFFYNLLQSFICFHKV